MDMINMIDETCGPLGRLTPGDGSSAAIKRALGFLVGTLITLLGKFKDVLNDDGIPTEDKQSESVAREMSRLMTSSSMEELASMEGHTGPLKEFFDEMDTAGMPGLNELRNFVENDGRRPNIIDLSDMPDDKEEAIAFVRAKLAENGVPQEEMSDAQIAVFVNSRESNMAMFEIACDNNGLIVKPVDLESDEDADGFESI